LAPQQIGESYVFPRSLEDNAEKLKSYCDDYGGGASQVEAKRTEERREEESGERRRHGFTCE